MTENEMMIMKVKASMFDAIVKANKTAQNDKSGITALCQLIANDDTAVAYMEKAQGNE